MPKIVAVDDHDRDMLSECDPVRGSVNVPNEAVSERLAGDVTLGV